MGRDDVLVLFVIFLLEKIKVYVFSSKFIIWHEGFLLSISICTYAGIWFNIEGVNSSLTLEHLGVG